MSEQDTAAGNKPEKRKFGLRKPEPPRPVNTNARVLLSTLLAGLLPLGFVMLYWAGACGFGTSLLLAALAAVAGAFFSAGLVINGLAHPMHKAAASVKKFIAAEDKLDAALPKEGWPEAAGLISSLNRLMLELSAYRAFQLNQVVEERAKAKALVETIADGILLIDDHGGLIYCNKTALKLLGIEKLAPDIRLPGSAKREIFAAALGKILASEEQYIETELEEKLTGGGFDEHKNYLIIANQFRLATLKKPGRAVAIRDITGAKEIANAKEAFFHMITHDMRSPLASIQGYADMLRMAAPQTPESAKYIQRIMESSKRLGGMINDILNTVKLQRGDMKLQLSPIAAKDLLTMVAETHAPIAAQKKIKLEALPSDAAFAGDGALLERVLSNLVGNALKFTPAGGSITLSCADAGETARLQVADTGPGIPPGKEKEIFAKYAQLDEHKAMGFGLGLAMCKLAVELHGGEIWVESEPGKGSRFIFTLPKKPAKQAA